MVTIKEIALECGVSFAAVSKALRDSPDIGPETTLRIKETAKKMGYSRNAAASSLKTGRSHMLGVLYYDRTGVGLAHEYFSLILESFKVQAASQGYGMLFVMNKVGQQQMTYYDYARSQGCDGVIIANLEYRDAEVIEMAQGVIPLVTVDYAFPNQDSVLSDNADCMEKLVDYVYARGHRRIAFIYGDLSDVTKTRLASFYNACAAHGLSVPPEYVIKGLFHDTETSAQATRQLLALSEPPTCILYPDDFSFIGGKNEIERQGLSIPKDVSVAGFDGILLSQVMTPRLTTIQQDARSIGKTAAELLIQRIEAKTPPAVQSVLVPGQLLPGETVKKI
jgi:LacI family transcriptional regulator